MTNALLSFTVPTVTMGNFADEDQTRRVKRLKVESNDTMDNESVTTEGANNQRVLEQFECPVCLEYISPPILQCSNGHLFCEDCREQLSTPANCPTCREPLPERHIRSFAMEQMAANLDLRFPCKYRFDGCHVSNSLTEKPNHEKKCESRPFQCPDIFGKCLWTGTADQVLPHLEGIHKFKNEEIKTQLHYNSGLYFAVMFGYDMSVPNLTKDANKNIRWLRIIGLKEHHLIFVMTRECISGHKMLYKAFLVLIGEQKSAERFKYKLQLSDESSLTPTSRISFEGRPYSVRDNVRSLVIEGSGLIFDSQVVKNFGKDEKLKMFVEIRYKLQN